MEGYLRGFGVGGIGEAIGFQPLDTTTPKLTFKSRIRYSLTALANPSAGSPAPLILMQTSFHDAHVTSVNSMCCASPLGADH